jgi:hypothetical protein
MRPSLINCYQTFGEAMDGQIAQTYAGTVTPNWTTYLSALLTPLIAIVAVYIAIRQWKTAHDKLKIDLFDKRLPVLEAGWTLIMASQAPNGASDEECEKFLAATGNAMWLYDKNIALYLRKDLYGMAVKVKEMAAKAADNSSKVEQVEIDKKISDVKSGLLNQMDVLIEKFSPFLQLPH